MDETPEPKPGRRPTVYKIRGPNTWAAARAMYLSGATATVVAETFDITVSNLRKRAAEEGWRKRDLPDLPCPPAMAEVGTRPADDGGLDIMSAARATIDQAAALMARGQFARATEAMKAAEMIGRLAERLPVSPNAEADDATVLDDLRRKIIALSTEVVSDAEDDRDGARSVTAG